MEYHPELNPSPEDTTQEYLHSVSDMIDRTRGGFKEVNAQLEGKTAEYGGMKLKDLRLDMDVSLVGTDENGARLVVPIEELANLTLREP